MAAIPKRSCVITNEGRTPNVCVSVVRSTLPQKGNPRARNARWIVGQLDQWEFQDVKKVLWFKWGGSSCVFVNPKRPTFQARFLKAYSKQNSRRVTLLKRVSHQLHLVAKPCFFRGNRFYIFFLSPKKV